MSLTKVQGSPKSGTEAGGGWAGLWLEAPEFLVAPDSHSSHHATILASGPQPCFSSRMFSETFSRAFQNPKHMISSFTHFNQFQAMMMTINCQLLSSCSAKSLCPLALTEHLPNPRRGCPGGFSAYYRESLGGHGCQNASECFRFLGGQMGDSEKSCHLLKVAKLLGCRAGGVTGEF